MVVAQTVAIRGADRDKWCITIDEKFEWLTKDGESPVVEIVECSERDPEYGETRGILSEDTQTTAKG